MPAPPSVYKIKNGLKNCPSAFFNNRFLAILFCYGSQDIQNDFFQNSEKTIWENTWLIFLIAVIVVTNNSTNECHFQKQNKSPSNLWATCIEPTTSYKYVILMPNVILPYAFL